MQTHPDIAPRRSLRSAPIFAGLTLAFTLVAPALATTPKPSDLPNAEPKSGAETYQTIYLNNATQQNDANDIVSDLRNMLTKARVYYVPAQGAISLRGTPEDIALAQKVVAEVDRPRKNYRLTYTITEVDNGKRVSAMHYTMVLLPGGKTSLKQGNRVPIVTGSTESGASTTNTQVQYVDLGLSIEASLDGYLDGLRLRTKVEQSSQADEKSGLGAQDPVIRQSTLESVSVISQGKPSMLGSLDIPGTTSHLEVEVTSELAK